MKPIDLGHKQASSGVRLDLRERRQVRIVDPSFPARAEYVVG